MNFWYGKKQAKLMPNHKDEECWISNDESGENQTKEAGISWNCGDDDVDVETWWSSLQWDDGFINDEKQWWLGPIKPLNWKLLSLYCIEEWQSLQYFHTGRHGRNRIY